jgi:hypothetical protein
VQSGFGRHQIVAAASAASLLALLGFGHQYVTPLFMGDANNTNSGFKWIVAAGHVAILGTVLAQTSRAFGFTLAAAVSGLTLAALALNGFATLLLGGWNESDRAPSAFFLLFLLLQWPILIVSFRALQKWPREDHDPPFAYAALWVSAAWGVSFFALDWLGRGY